MEKRRKCSLSEDSFGFLENVLYQKCVITFLGSDAKWPVLVAIDVKWLRSHFSFLLCYNKCHCPSGHSCLLYYLPGNISHKAKKGSQQPLPCRVLKSPGFCQRTRPAFAWWSSAVALFSGCHNILLHVGRFPDTHGMSFMLSARFTMKLMWTFTLLHVATKCSEIQYFSYE